MADPTAGPYGDVWGGMIQNPTGADADPVSGITIAPSHNGLRRLSNELRTSPLTTTTRVAFTGFGTVGPNCQIAARVDTPDSSDGTEWDLMLGIDDITSGSPNWTELAVTVHTAAAEAWEVDSMVAGTPTAVVTGPTQEVSATNVVCMTKRIVGGHMLIDGWYWNGSWTNKISYDKASPTAAELAAGYLGIEASTGSQLWGPFWGGAITLASGSSNPKARTLTGVG